VGNGPNECPSLACLPFHVNARSSCTIVKMMRPQVGVGWIGPPRRAAIIQFDVTVKRG
jgi:hypothetical protein